MLIGMNITNFFYNLVKNLKQKGRRLNCAASFSSHQESFTVTPELQQECSYCCRQLRLDSREFRTCRVHGPRQTAGVWSGIRWILLTVSDHRF